jgi:hypothetical protein
VLSSHFSPGFAPQVGQGVSNIGLVLLFMTRHYAKLSVKILFTLAQLKISLLQRSVSVSVSADAKGQPEGVGEFGFYDAAAERVWWVASCCFRRSSAALRR